MWSYLSSLVEFFSRSCWLTRPLAAVVTRTSSAVVVHTGEHLFKIVGHSKLKGSGASVTSKTFRVGGHEWAVVYYPNGGGSNADGQFSSAYLELVSAIESEVTASFYFCLQDPTMPAIGDKKKQSFTATFLPSITGKGQSWGHDFVSKSELAASGCLVNDSVVIKCSVAIHGRMDEDDSITVPPSDLSKDLRNLLERGFKADLTIGVGPFRTFKVHGCMLAARSPVFRAQLCGFMRESKQRRINIDDMDADVFELLLYYMYNDCLPDFMDGDTEEATNMAQHLLVAADRYAVERLKLMCESKLSKALDVNTVGFILDLAERYNCCQLKPHCLYYIETKCVMLGAIEKTEGFAQLKVNHPRLARDILAKARQCRKNEQNLRKNGNKLQKK